MLGRSRRRWLALVAALVLALMPMVGLAHPLGNFSVNRFARVLPRADAVDIHYVIDMAEIPTFQAMSVLDADGDGTVSAAEGQAYLVAMREETLPGLSLTADGVPLPITVVEAGATWELLPGQGGLQTLRMSFDLQAPLTLRELTTLVFRDTSDDRMGWREIIAVGSESAALQESSVPSTSSSDELRVYPDELLSSPLAVQEATILVAPGAGASGTVPLPERAPSDRTAPTATEARLTALLNLPEPTPGVLLGAVLLAMVLGAGHAMTPGHGKAVVAAYMVGSRGTARHALFLGLTVTITHTAGVFILGIITLFASRYILPEQLFPWISLLSGVLVVGIGLSLFLTRLTSATHTTDEAGGHSHGPWGQHQHGPGQGHHHLPPGARRSLSWRSLLALGISGGLLPCPSALVLLLAAIAVGRVGFGLLLIVAFSIGLAGVLTVIGLLLVYANRFFQKLPQDGRLPGLLRLVPVASALVITLAGVGISYQALRSIFL